MSIMIDKNGIEWRIVGTDSYGYTILERKKPDHWICGVFYGGEIHEVEEGCQFDTSKSREWTATRRYGWITTNEED